MSAQVAVTQAQALAWRLGRHLLDPVGTEPVEEVVRRLHGVPAMDGSAAELAVRTRRRSSMAGELDEARAAGDVVTVFAFRGAVHHLPAADAGTWLALRCAGRQWELTSWVEHYGLGAEDWPAFRAAVREALSDGPLTIEELGLALTAQPAYRHLAATFAGDPWTLMKPLSWQGDMGFGPRREGRTTLQRLDAGPRWTGLPDLEEAGPRAGAAYARSYGPVTPAHVQYWLGEGLSAGRARLRRWWDGLGERLVAVDVEGTTGWMWHEDVADLLAAPTEGSSVVRLLPGHDPWVIGPGTKDEQVTPAALRTAMTRRAAPVVWGGRVCGTWARRREDLVVSWADERPHPGAALAAEAERLAALLGGDLRLVVD